jgi:hypothetical protein
MTRPQDNAPHRQDISRYMNRANFCTECGERLAQNGWRAVLRRRWCGRCARRLGNFATYRPLVIIVLMAAGAFGFGRYLRPSPPPLIIERAANSPLSDAAVHFSGPAVARANQTARDGFTRAATDDEVYICGARTKKGTPCRRRVHAAGERCFQHKGLPAMVSLDKLVIKSSN